MDSLAHMIEILEDPEKSLKDKKEYRIIKLKNGLTALLISDLASLTESHTYLPKDNSGSTGNEKKEEEEKNKEKAEDKEKLRKEEKKLSTENIEQDNRLPYMCSAALCVGVGSLQDPPEIQGLMRLLEHIKRFSSSEKYPEENGFKNLCEEFGGHHYAKTTSESMTFYFNIQENHFEKCLDMFSNFFVSLHLKEEEIQKKVEAIQTDFEYSTFFYDTFRMKQLITSVANQGHPISFFHHGNEKSLHLNVSNKELYSKLHDMWHKYYSAQNMTLAVQSRETLDKLQDLVVSMFSEIPNNELPGPCYEKFDFPFSQEKFHKLLKVIPLYDGNIQLSWAMPPLNKKFYESKPLKYISHLIGHGGPGSIVSYLKYRDWAVAVDPDWTFLSSSFCEIFFISIYVTDEGRLHMKEIIQLVFQYIRLMKEEGPNQRTFSELQKMAQIDFDFTQEKLSLDSVISSLEGLRTYPSKHILTGESLLFKYDSEIIENCLSSMKVNNCNIMLKCKQFESQNLSMQEEEWFGTKYHIEDIPQEWIEEWENSPPNPMLHLPLPNDFIPDDFEVYKWQDSTRDPPEFPQNIESNDKGKLWFKQDFKYCLPRAYCIVYFRFLGMEKNSEMEAMLDMFTTYFRTHLTEEMYSASLAQYEISPGQCDMGFALHLHGYNQKLYECLEMCLSQIANIDSFLNQKRFYELKQEQLNHYLILDPHSFQEHIHLCILGGHRWPAAEKMKVVEGLQRDQFISAFLNEIFPNKYVDVLVHGNIVEEDAKKMFHSIIKTSSVSNSELKCPKTQVRRCKSGEYVARFQSFSTSRPDTSIINYYQGELSSLRTELVHEFVDLAMLSDYTANEKLKDHDKWGYYKRPSAINTFGVLGITVLLFSPADNFSFSLINEKIESFLKTFAENLKKLPKEKVLDLIQEMKNKRLSQNRSLNEEALNNLERIIQGDYLFDRHMQQLSIIPTITLEEASEHFENLVFPKNKMHYRKLSLQVIGSTIQREEYETYENTFAGKSAEEILELFPPTEEDLKGSLSNAHFLSQLRPFIDQLSFFESPAQGSI